MEVAEVSPLIQTPTSLAWSDVGRESAVCRRVPVEITTGLPSNRRSLTFLLDNCERRYWRFSNSG